jgi:hypothetical protein
MLTWLQAQLVDLLPSSIKKCTFEFFNKIKFFYWKCDTFCGLKERSTFFCGQNFELDVYFFVDGGSR